MRSPRSAPWEKGLVGSTATMPTLRPRLAVFAREGADEGALAGARGAGDADDVGFAGVREEVAQGFAGFGVTVLDPGEDAGERAAVAVENALCGLGGHAPAAAAPRLGALLRTQSMMSWVEEPGPKMP